MKPRMLACLSLLLSSLLLAAPRGAGSASVSLGAFALPPDGKPAQLQLWSAASGSNTSLCYALSSPTDTRWAGRTGCLPTGLPSVISCALWNQVRVLQDPFTVGGTAVPASPPQRFRPRNAPQSRVGGPFSHSRAGPGPTTRRTAPFPLAWATWHRCQVL